MHLAYKKDAEGNLQFIGDDAKSNLEIITKNTYKKAVISLVLANFLLS